MSSNELGSLNDDCVSRGCAAYPCFEETAHCGNEGYLIAFGEKYCRRFISPGRQKFKTNLVGHALYTFFGFNRNLRNI